MKEKNLIEIIKNSKSKNEILLKYFGYSNKKVYDFLNNFIIEKNINIIHLNKKIKHCLQCSKIIKRRNKFCNSSCAATFNNHKRILSIETRNKIKNSLINTDKYRALKYYDTKRTCIICGNEFNAKRLISKKLSKTKCCSTECQLKMRRKNGQIIAKERISNGTHKGWNTRNIVSYPEKFFMKVLDNNNI